MKELITVFTKIDTLFGLKLPYGHILNNIIGADIDVKAEKKGRESLMDSYNKLANLLPDVIEVLTGEENQMILSVYGPLEKHDLIPVISFVCDCDYPGRFVLNETSNLTKGSGYVYGSVNFDFDYKWTSKMFNDEKVHLMNPNNFYGVVVPEERSEEILKMNFGCMDDLSKISNIGEAFFYTYYDFNCFVFVSKTKSPQEILEEVSIKHDDKIEITIKPLNDFSHHGF